MRGPRTEARRPAKTHVSGVVHTLRDVELLVRQPGEQALDLSARRVPAAQCARDVAVRELTLERRRPALAIGLVASVEDSAVELVDVGRGPGLAGVLPARDGLDGERTLGDADLVRGNQAVRRLATVGRWE